MNRNPKSIKVKLTWYELMQSGLVGVMRQVEGLKDGRKHRYGMDPQKGWSNHVEGAAGEQAFAKAINLFWSGSVNTFKHLNDVGRFEVRTRSKHSYELLVRPNDKDEDIFVHVTGLAPDFIVRGWMTGKEAKTYPLKPYGGREPAHFPPNSDLHDVRELKTTPSVA